MFSVQNKWETGGKVKTQINPAILDSILKSVIKTLLCRIEMELHELVNRTRFPEPDPEIHPKTYSAFRNALEVLAEAKGISTETALSFVREAARCMYSSAGSKITIVDGPFPVLAVTHTMLLLGGRERLAERAIEAMHRLGEARLQEKQPEAGVVVFEYTLQGSRFKMTEVNPDIVFAAHSADESNALGVNRVMVTLNIEGGAESLQNKIVRITVEDLATLEGTSVEPGRDS